METNIKSNGSVEFNNCRIMWPNFEGRSDNFNPAGLRNFCLVIDDEECYEALKNCVNKYGKGYNVKRKEFDDGSVRMHLQVKLNFGTRPPAIYLRCGDNMHKLTEETVGILDKIDIENVDLDISPYDSENTQGCFRTAYLQRMCVTQVYDRFADKYDFDPLSDLSNADEEVPF